MNWDQYTGFLTNWATASEWDGLFKRVSEVDGVVFLELEERTKMGDFESVVNSISVYEFTADDKIRHIDVYLQMALPNIEMLTSYEELRSRVSIETNRGDVDTVDYFTEVRPALTNLTPSDATVSMCRDERSRVSTAERDSTGCAYWSCTPCRRLSNSLVARHFSALR